MKRIITLIIAVLALAPTALATAPLASSYHVRGTIHGIPATASNTVSPPFARAIVKAVYTKFTTHGGWPWPMRSWSKRVYSTVTHQSYLVRFYSTHGTSWPVTCWVDHSHGWVKVYYGN